MLLLAETGLLDGREVTIHWAFAPTFHRNFPRVRLRTEEVLITVGERDNFVMTGGVMSWHDLALHLLARHVGPGAAHSIARMLMLEWHGEGQAPYIEFAPDLDHDDALIAELQAWLKTQYAIVNPVDEMVAGSGLNRRTLERTNKPVDAIGFEVGYENTAFFLRVFKRTTRLTPSAYRRKFQMRGL